MRKRSGRAVHPARRKDESGPSRNTTVESDSTSAGLPRPARIGNHHRLHSHARRSQPRGLLVFGLSLLTTLLLLLVARLYYAFVFLPAVQADGTALSGDVSPGLAFLTSPAGLAFYGLAALLILVAFTAVALPLRRRHRSDG